MIRVEVRSYDAEQTYATLLFRIASFTIDAQPLIRSIVRDLEKLHALYFDSEAGPAGAWKPLSPRTIEKKGHDQILFETGRLRESLAARTPESIREIGGDIGRSIRIKFGTIRPFAGLHQRGSLRIPRRVHVGMRVEEAKAIRNRVAAAVVRHLLVGKGGSDAFQEAVA